MWLNPENFEALANIHVFDEFKNIQFTYLSAPGQREQWGSLQNPFQSRDVLLLCFTFKADFRFSLNSPKNLLPPYDLWLHIESPSEVLVIYKWVSLPIPYTPFCPTVGIQVYLQVSARQLIQTIWAGTHDPTPSPASPMWARQLMLEKGIFSRLLEDLKHTAQITRTSKECCPLEWYNSLFWAESARWKALICKKSLPALSALPKEIKYT